MLFPKAAPAAGSWAGPAWFWLGEETRVVGGVLGRAGLGLAWGEPGWWGRGGGKGFFEKYGFLFISDITSQRQILQMTAFLRSFFKFLPNRFRLEMKPHELVWKSVRAILHGFVVNIFKVFFKF